MGTKWVLALYYIKIKSSNRLKSFQRDRKFTVNYLSPFSIRNQPENPATKAFLQVHMLQPVVLSG